MRGRWSDGRHPKISDLQLFGTSCEIDLDSGCVNRKGRRAEANPEFPVASIALAAAIRLNTPAPILRNSAVERRADARQVERWTPPQDL
jgi:hypothetical protein